MDPQRALWRPWGSSSFPGAVRCARPEPAASRPLRPQTMESTVPEEGAAWTSATPPSRRCTARRSASGSSRTSSRAPAASTRPRTASRRHHRRHGRDGHVRHDHPGGVRRHAASGRRAPHLRDDHRARDRARRPLHEHAGLHAAHHRLGLHRQPLWHRRAQAGAPPGRGRRQGVRRHQHHRARRRLRPRRHQDHRAVERGEAGLRHERREGLRLRPQGVREVGRPERPLHARQDRPRPGPQGHDLHLGPRAPRRHQLHHLQGHGPHGPQHRRLDLQGRRAAQEVRARRRGQGLLRQHGRLQRRPRARGRRLPRRRREGPRDQRRVHRPAHHLRQAAGQERGHLLRDGRTTGCSSTCSS